MAALAESVVTIESIKFKVLNMVKVAKPFKGKKKLREYTDTKGIDGYQY